MRNAFSIFAHLLYPLVKALYTIYWNSFTKLIILTRIYFKYRIKPNKYDVVIQYTKVYFAKAFFLLPCVQFLNLSSLRLVTAELVYLSVIFQLVCKRY